MSWPPGYRERTGGQEHVVAGLLVGVKVGVQHAGVNGDEAGHSASARPDRTKPNNP